MLHYFVVALDSRTFEHQIKYKVSIDSGFAINQH